MLGPSSRATTGLPDPTSQETSQPGKGQGGHASPDVALAREWKAWSLWDQGWEQPHQHRLHCMSLCRRPLTLPHPITPRTKFFPEPFAWGRSGHKRTSFRLPRLDPTVTPVSQRRHTLLPRRPRTYCFMASSLESMLSLLPLHQLHVGQQLVPSCPGESPCPRSAGWTPGSPGEQSLKGGLGAGRDTAERGPRGCWGGGGTRWGGRRGMGSRQERAWHS